MSILIPEKELPLELSNEQAVEAAYSAELAEVASKLQRGLPCLVECDKDLAPFLFINLRGGLLGIARPRLRHLVTQKESRKFGPQFNPWGLYKHVSGVNAVRLRKLLSTLEGEDYPADAKKAYRQLRQATLVGSLEVPNLDLEHDIGGYAKVKQRLRNEVLDILTIKDRSGDADENKNLENLPPQGKNFWGPPRPGQNEFPQA